MELSDKCDTNIMKWLPIKLVKEKLVNLCRTHEQIKLVKQNSLEISLMNVIYWQETISYAWMHCANAGTNTHEQTFFKSKYHVQGWLIGKYIDIVNITLQLAVLNLKLFYFIYISLFFFMRTLGSRKSQVTPEVKICRSQYFAVF